MFDESRLPLERARTWARLLPRLEADWAGAMPAADWATFRARLEAHFPDLFQLLVRLYGGRYDFYHHLEQILGMAASMWRDRPAELKALDATREADATWFQSQRMLGGVLYVDLFARDLKALRAQVPAFQALGLTYLHLMPLFKAPDGDSDGGYAVSDYRTVNPALGSMDDLRALADDLRAAGISLVLDFVFNHTSDEHRWARAAQASDPDYADYYFLFDDRTVPDAYDRSLREIFPDKHAGNFTWRADIKKWVWTTFNVFQWDLNYQNPAVFRNMAAEMLFLANAGAEVLRLDALAFVWKQMGTVSESLPEAHLLVQAFNAVVRIAAPSLLFKSEAIVHPDEVARYISPRECQLSYNPLLMALLWNSLATREVRLLRRSMSHRFAIDPACAWVNYVRCHDDIGWTFDDTDAAQLGINGYDHRRFLNEFYTGRFPGSFARGLPFQENPRTGDARISGPLASLAGLERALQLDDAGEIELAIRRIVLLHAVILSIGGIPLLYLGDEVGWLNDYSFRNDPVKSGDSRWVHRPRIDAARLARGADPATLEGRIYARLHHLIQMRVQTAAFAGNAMQVLPLGNDHVFGFVRAHATGVDGGGRVMVLVNFSEGSQAVQANDLRVYGLGYRFTDLMSGSPLVLGDADVVMEPYQVLWLAGEG